MSTPSKDATAAVPCSDAHVLDRLAALEELVNTLEARLSVQEREEFHAPLASFDHSFGFARLTTLSVEIPSTVVPDIAQAIELMFTFRSGNEPPSRWVDYSVWLRSPQESVDGEVVEFRKPMRGFRYPQSAISFCSEKIWFPFNADFRTLYFQPAGTKDIQARNCDNVHVTVSGWK